jgi:hypothetical protein
LPLTKPTGSLISLWVYGDFREKMESDTQRALLKVDEEVSTLRTQLQNQSPPSTRIGAGTVIR